MLEKGNFTIANAKLIQNFYKLAVSNIKVILYMFDIKGENMVGIAGFEPATPDTP